MKGPVLVISAPSVGLAAPAYAADKAAVVAAYADLAEAGHEGSAITIKRLQGAVSALIAPPSADALKDAKLDAIMSQLGRTEIVADAGFAHDQMIERGNVTGEAKVMGGANALIGQTRSIERAVSPRGLEQIDCECADSLDNPSAVF